MSSHAGDSTVPVTVNTCASRAEEWVVFIIIILAIILVVVLFAVTSFIWYPLHLLVNHQEKKCLSRLS